jgi:hypothetical protein
MRFIEIPALITEDIEDPSVVDITEPITVSISGTTMTIDGGSKVSGEATVTLTGDTTVNAFTLQNIRAPSLHKISVKTGRKGNFTYVPNDTVTASSVSTTTKTGSDFEILLITTTGGETYVDFDMADYVSPALYTSNALTGFDISELTSTYGATAKLYKPDGTLLTTVTSATTGNGVNFGYTESTPQDVTYTLEVEDDLGRTSRYDLPRKWISYAMETNSTPGFEKLALAGNEYTSTTIVPNLTSTSKVRVHKTGNHGYLGINFKIQGRNSTGDDWVDIANADEDDEVLAFGDFLYHRVWVKPTAKATTSVSSSNVVTLTLTDFTEENVTTSFTGADPYDINESTNTYVFEETTKIGTVPFTVTLGGETYTNAVTATTEGTAYDYVTLAFANPTLSLTTSNVTISSAKLYKDDVLFHTYGTETKVVLRTDQTGTYQAIVNDVYYSNRVTPDFTTTRSVSAPQLEFDGYNKLTLANYITTTSDFPSIITFDASAWDGAGTTIWYVLDTTKSTDTSKFYEVNTPTTGDAGNDGTATGIEFRCESDGTTKVYANTDDNTSQPTTLNVNSTSYPSNYVDGVTITSGDVLYGVEGSFTRFGFNVTSSMLFTRTVITPTSTTLGLPDGTTRDLTTQSNVYIYEPGTYTANVQTSETFAYLSNVVTSQPSQHPTDVGPTFTFDEYNRLAISNLTQTSSTLEYGSNTYDTNTASNVYVTDTGEYKLEARDANTFVISNVYVGAISTDKYDYSLSSSGQQKITASGGSSTEYFGRRCAISGDKMIVTASSYNSGQGAAYIFTKSGTSWSQQQRLTVSGLSSSTEPQFGHGADISGNYAIVGAYEEDTDGTNAGGVYIYYFSGGTWTQQARIVSSDIAAGDVFGYAVSIDGDYAIVGAQSADPDDLSNAGASYIFKRSGTSWTQQAKLTASDAAEGDVFGRDVAIKGDYAIVGCYSGEAAYIFKKDTGAETWTQKAILTASDASGTAYFGNSVSMSGDYVIVGAKSNDANKGAAYIFKKDTGAETWTQQAKLIANDVAENDEFGWSVSIDNGLAIVGSLNDDDGSSSSGSAYVFARDGAIWSQQVKLTASDAASNDNFGNSVAIDGDFAVVGARGDESSTGAAYIFQGVKSFPSLTFDGYNKLTIDNVDTVETATIKKDGVAFATTTSNTVYIRDTGTYTAEVKGSGAYAIELSKEVNAVSSSLKSFATPTETKFTGVSGFGEVCDISGNKGIIGNRDGNYVYFIEKTGTGWSYNQVTEDSSSRFGWKVGISGDYAAVASHSIGKVTIYKHNGTSWSEIHSVTNTTNYADGLAMDGTNIITGQRYQGKVRILSRVSDTNWTVHTLTLTTYTSSYWGHILDISGDYAITGIPDNDSSKGAVAIFYWSGSSWAQQGSFIKPSIETANDEFGTSVSISENYAVIGVPFNNSSTGCVYIFTRNGTSWGSEDKIVANDASTGDKFGYSVKLSGDYIIVGAREADIGSVSNAGAVYIFKRDGSSWSQTSKIVASDGVTNDYFGHSVSISGDNAIVGAYGGYFGYVYEKSLSGPNITYDNYNKITLKNTNYEDTATVSDPNGSIHEIGTAKTMYVKDTGEYVFKISGTDKYAESNVYVSSVDLAGATTKPIDFDGYNKLTLIDAGSNVSANVTYFSNTYELGSANVLYINGAGTYGLEMSGSNVFALSSNVVGAISTGVIANPVFTSTTAITTDTNWTSGSGWEITADSTNNSTDRPGWKAFDNTWETSNEQNIWHSAETATSTSSPKWLKIKYPSAYKAIQYSIQIRDLSYPRYPKTWKFQGSNNDSDWTDLDTQTNKTDWAGNNTVMFTFSNSTAYQYYRVYITATDTSDSDGGCCIRELKVYTLATGSQVGNVPLPDYTYPNTITVDSALSGTSIIIANDSHQVSGGKWYTLNHSTYIGNRFIFWDNAIGYWSYFDTQGNRPDSSWDNPGGPPGRFFMETDGDLKLFHGSNGSTIMHIKPNSSSNPWPRISAPSLTFDGYNKLTLENFTTTESDTRTAKLTDPNGSTYALGQTQDAIYIKDQGDYFLEVTNSDQSAVVKTTVGTVTSPPTYQYIGFGGMTDLSGSYTTTNTYLLKLTKADGTPLLYTDIETFTILMDNGNGTNLDFTHIFEETKEPYAAAVGATTTTWHGDSQLEVTALADGTTLSDHATNTYIAFYFKLNEPTTIIDGAILTVHRNDKEQWKNAKAFGTNTDPSTFSSPHTPTDWTELVEVTTVDGPLGSYNGGSNPSEPWTSLGATQDFNASAPGLYIQPSLTFDGYNKLSIENITPISTSLRLGSNTYDIGTASNVYIEHAGTYKFATGDANTFALVSNVVGAIATGKFDPLDTTSDYSILGSAFTPSTTSDTQSKTSLSNDGTRVLVDNDTGYFIQVYEYSSGSWTQLGSDINYGTSSTSSRISGDGNRVCVGISSSNQVKVYEYSSGSWSQIGTTITGSNGFGTDTSLNYDGTRLMVGASGDYNTRGNQTVWQESGGNWTQLGSTLYCNHNSHPHSLCGGNVDINNDGTVVCAGGYKGHSQDKGCLHVWKYNGSSWTQSFFSEGGNDHHSNYCRLSGDGKVVMYSHDRWNEPRGRVNFYENTSGASWSQIGGYLEDKKLGDLSNDGKTVVVGKSDASIDSQVYRFDGSAWVQLGSNLEHTSTTLSISSDGSTVAIGNSTSGANKVSVYKGTTPSPIRTRSRPLPKPTIRQKR